MAHLSKARWLLVFFLFALPITFSPFTYLAFELPKVLLLFFVCIGVFFITLISGYRPTRSSITLLLLFFLCWILLSSVLGLSFQQSLLGSYFRLQGLITWVCYSVLFLTSGKLLEDRHFKKYASLGLLVGSSAAAVLAAIQFISLWFLGNTSQLLYSGRVISTFGQPNFLGAFLTISLPFVWYLAKHAAKKWQVVIYFLMMIIILGVFSTLSRSAYLGLVVLALIWGTRHYRLLLTSLIFCIVLFAVLANLLPYLVFNEWHRFQVDKVALWSAENRLQIGQKSLQLVTQKPITGFGLENFALAFPGVVSSKDTGLKDIVVDSAHNLFLDLIVQTGLIGLGLFLTLLAVIFKKGKHLKAAPPEETDFIKAAMSAVLTFLAIHQFSPVSTAPAVLLWLSLGIISGPLIQHFSIHLFSKFIITLSGIALMIIVSSFMIQTIRAEILFREAGSFEVSDIQRAIKLDNEAIRLAPWILFYQARRNFLLKQLGY